MSNLMRKITIWAFCLLLSTWLLGCLSETEASLDFSTKAHIGTWSPYSVSIEKVQIKIACEKDSTRKTIIQSDTLEFNSSYPEFKSDTWKLVITSDSIYSPNSIEDRIRFDWTLQPALYIENDFLSEGFHYKINEDSLILSSQRINLPKNIRYFYRINVEGQGSVLNLFPEIQSDSTRAPSPRPSSNCFYLDSIQWKARLVSVSLKKINE